MVRVPRLMHKGFGGLEVGGGRQEVKSGRWKVGSGRKIKRARLIFRQEENRARAKRTR